MIYGFAFISVIIFSLALFMLLETMLFRIYARSLRATIVGYELSTNDGKRFYHPVAEYKDGGRQYRIKSSIGSNSVDFETGSGVTVLMFGRMHSSARIKQRSRLLIGFILMIMGLGFILPLKLETGLLVWDWYIVAAVLFAVVLLYVSFKWQTRNESSFDYRVGEDGFIGYQKTENFTSDALKVKPYVVPAWARVLSLVLGIGLLAGGWYAYEHKRLFLQNAYTAEGTVVELLAKRDSEGTLTYAPKVRFTPLQSLQEVTFVSKVSSSHPSVKPGDFVTVLYDPGDAKDAIIDRGKWNYIISMAMTGGGLLVLLVTIVGVITQRKRAQEPTRN